MNAPNVEAPCMICGGRQGNTHTVREMMFGSGRPYQYFACAACGCLQRLGSVAIEDQYPPGYYAHRPRSRRRGFRGLLRAWRNRAVFCGGLLRPLARLAPYPIEGAAEWFRRAGARRSSRILDVGCGTGDLVHDLVEAGFTRVTGIDPFLPGEARARTGSHLRRAWLHEEEGEYDLIMLHHVLEHMPDQHQALRDVARLLHQHGTCLIRIPVLPNRAWTDYREHWVQIDAPRHVVIHSPRSLEIAARRAGLVVEHVAYDSTEFQFTGSELYKRGLPLSELPRFFSAAERRRFAAKATALNRSGDGDQAAFYLRHIR